MSALRQFVPRLPLLRACVPRSAGRRCAAGFVLALAASQPGCALFMTPSEAWMSLKHTFSPSDDYYVTGTKPDEDRQWRVAGEEGRRGQAVEKDPDQWYRKYFMTSKAREIERNLGFE